MTLKKVQHIILVALCGIVIGILPTVLFQYLITDIMWWVVTIPLTIIGFVIIYIAYGKEE